MSDQVSGYDSRFLYVNKILVLFEDDPGVEVQWIGEDYVKLVVYDVRRYAAFRFLFPETIIFKDCVLNIDIVLCDKNVFRMSDAIKEAMNGNPLFCKVIENQGKSYAVFKPEATQYWDGNHSDPHGIKTVVAADLARDVFTKSGCSEIIFCSEATNDRRRILLERGHGQ